MVVLMLNSEDVAERKPVGINCLLTRCACAELLVFLVKLNIIFSIYIYIYVYIHIYKA
jgi:hypothetical protein